MAIVPSGLPAWSKTADLQSYGGNLNKVNYQSQGVTNPLTDISAEQHARMCEDTAAITRTAPFATLTVQCDDVTPGPPTITAIDMMTGVQLASYVGNVPPTGFPSASRLGNSAVRVTFASSYSDDYGVSESLTIRHAKASPHGTTALTEAVTVASPDVEVRIFVSNTGVAAVGAKFSLSVSS
jgi:hypothetical protein